MNLELKLNLIGKIKDAHGLKGEVLVIVFSKDYSPWTKLSEFYLATDEKSSPVLTKIVSIRQASLGLIVKMQGFTDRNQSEKMKGQLVFVPQDLLKSKEGERIFLKEILNFQVYNKSDLVGEIIGFSSNGPQDILLVKSHQSQNPIEIPFVEAFILKLDHKNKTIKMDLPEGLLEINSSGDKKS